LKKVPNQKQPKEKIDENPKPRSEKKEAHEETKTLKSMEYGLKEKLF